METSLFLLFCVFMHCVQSHLFVKRIACCHQALDTENGLKSCKSMVFLISLNIFLHIFYFCLELTLVKIPGGPSDKGPACQWRRQKTWGQSLGKEDSLEEEMTVHSSIFFLRIPLTGEPGRLQFI